MMPFKPTTDEADYPELYGTAKRDWPYWAGEQEKNLRRAIGDELYDWLKIKGGQAHEKMDH